MTETEWAYHRERAIQIGPLGLCSRMQSGKIKIEGQAPMTENQLLNWIPVAWSHYLEKLRSLA